MWKNNFIPTRLKTDEIKVILVDLQLTDEEYVNYWQFLSADEKLRAQKFSYVKHRNYFIAARGKLRQLLAQQLDADPVAIEFTYNEAGKPQLVDNSLQFNVSHTDHKAVIALTRQSSVGIDIEYRLRDLDLDGVASHLFTDAEQHYMQSAAQKRNTFFAIWTRKEALLKALGEGIFSPAKELCVLPDKVQYQQQKFYIHQLPAYDDYQISIAYQLDEKGNALFFSLYSD